MTSKTFDFSDFLAEGLPPSLVPQPVVRPTYDFAVGYPDPESFPADGLHEALGRALKDHGRDLVLYPHRQGLPELRKFVAEKLQRERGMRVEPDQVVLTSGSGPAIAMYTQLFTNPGDTIVTDYFTYLGALAIMRGFGTNIVGVPTDEEGMRADALDQTIQDLQRQGKRPKFIYTIPSFQNPLGTDMKVERRQGILAVAQKHGIPIYEDDAYEDLRFEGDRYPAIHSYDDSDMVLYSGTFSKIVAPGMRMGYMVAPQDLVPRITGMHWGTPPSQFSALAILYYLRDNMENHVAELCDVYRSRRDTMLGSIGEFMGTSAEVTRPSGGMYIWVRLPEGVNAAVLADKSREKGAAYLPGPSFSPRGDGQNCFRLCFGYENHQGIRDGIAMIAEVFQEGGLLK
ncbi:MAG: PLP-dependent aminotransferase family protein [Dehalococcoidia bacterium]